MANKISWKLIALLAAWLAVSSMSRASPLIDRLCHRQDDCPPGSYSPLHYWAPTLYRLHASHQGGTLDSYTPTNHPDLTAQYRINRYPCPSVDPVVSAAEYPH